MTRRDETTKTVDLLLAADEALADDGELLADLTLMSPPMQPAPGALDRLLDAVDGGGRFEHLVGAVADLVAVTRDKARALLGLTDAVDAWEAGPRPWIRLVHLHDVGVARAVVGLVHIEPGRDFPHHVHLGEEHVLVLQGCVDDGQRVLRAGQVGRMAPDTAHALTAGAEAPLIYLAVVFEGLEIDGVPLRA